MMIDVGTAVSVPWQTLLLADPDLLPDRTHRSPSSAPALSLPSRRQHVIAGWSILAIGMTFVEAIARLGARAVEAVQLGLTPAQWAAFVASVLTLTWFEGYRALHRRFAPAVVGRALDTGARAAGVLGFLGAPFRALSLYGASRKEMTRAWLSVALIILAVVVVSSLPPVWRGIVDAGVASALTLGLCSLVGRFVLAIRPGHGHGSGQG